MKYKLINKQTGEEHFCEKIVVDGMDYYVSDGETKWAIDETNKLVNLWFYPEKLKGFVLATNNPDMDIPQILEQPNETLIHQIAADLGYRMLPNDLEEGIKAGYNKSQETHPFSEEDLKNALVSFHKMNMAYLTGKEDDNLDIQEFITNWKEQQSKILYYGLDT